MSEGVRVAILGATGAVGAELLELLATRSFPVAELKLLASPQSAGKMLNFKGEPLTVEAVTSESFRDIDLVLASAGSAISKAWAQTAVESGAVTIDNSSAFRMDPKVPLVIPEINPQAIATHHGIVANPNCSTILMAMAAYPLHREQPIRRAIVATYQSASGAGARAMTELKTQARSILDGKAPPTEAFPFPLAFNVFPHNSDLSDNGYCQEELKMVYETRKIFGVPDLRMTATCVRVPVLRAHSEAVNLEFDAPFPASRARALLADAPGVTLLEDWQANRFPMPIDAAGQDDVFVGRIRQDLSHPCGLELWLSGDQIRKGAALNAVQIAELLLRERGLRPTAAATENLVRTE
ncbi:aspartate-semialdehyde dehydrogenase [Rubidibacter lacunae KORDI 51-2]|uniref:Aspartate-semialdehyde dehydrogenase n=1 Tax=Rubidibacter lacunae KORDI 51-2 TaxID=582515 RepID=U5DRD0_9CHRO|nr:aspartate-semialdehyde dehydrogenase [Rubidibacter lacunae]ERN43164.1 aspartate-semialdehyde dehydrogenase [Rubidibacter lacunae KORDI 51-2]